MSGYEFTVKIDRVLTDDELDRLFEAGGDDCTPQRSPSRGVTFLRFTRDGSWAGEALDSCLDTVVAAGLPWCSAYATVSGDD